MQEQQILVNDYDFGSQAQHYAASDTESSPLSTKQLVQSDTWKQLSDGLYDYGHCVVEEKEALFNNVKAKLNELHMLICSEGLIYSALPSTITGRENNDGIKHTPLLRDELMRVDVLTIYGSNPTPLHDHPGQSGVYLCLNGPTAFTQYDENKSVISRDYPITKLSRTHFDTISKGEMLPLDPYWGNILELQSLSQYSLLLTAHYQCEEAPRRHWYFPITPKRHDQVSFFAQRLTRYG